MYDTIYLLVKATIQTTHKTALEAITEIQEKATCTITDTKRVKIKELKFMDYKLKV
ncbi:hypothetical protein HDF24_14670 [Mucilaginibacter sp. X4EP1]|uniref:hypothetical protein n=1 Tax=Mucilaginibacter sp. X4EP1 TaxID=2723092 RepID=UPI00216790EE|nr:hypothetical protein [Mucilaginibacter sp. X4EP1]MCS3815462.1 hypothetical protein [Mucilaginibacter sp. X4EP1]